MQTTDKPRSVKTGNTFVFEAETCGRCGGSGHYSYNQMDGSRCYGCGGHGVRLTKRGAEAQRVYHESLKVPAETIVPGQLVHNGGIPGMIPSGFHRVTDVTVDGDRVRINADGYGLGAFVGSPVRVGWSADEKAAKQAAALAYQDTLTKQGKPRKARS